ncbi:branched-chain amino acid ABC transporter permease [Phytohabitans flavus]|uniref:Branched-chain amino acid ABC transporter permease n=1 Tax=Phytohabitans flavus TaxID=1076124 RepID=A0A6F8XND9_9ACTN|nr:branched-chain amino acid ABC transporter permease [Phytohabitans flavus]BCB75330.1 branched-chain amino acid ABC transporter permease [Phytohabitans flavus]
MNAYLPGIATVALMYGALGLSLNLQVGRTGIINFGHIAFFGVGVYTTALLSLHGIPLWLSVPAAAVAGGLCAIPLGWAAARLTSHYLAIVTIGFAEALRVVLLNLEVTGGPSGLVGVPRPLGDAPLETFSMVWLVLAAGLLALTYGLVRLFTRGLLGLSLTGIHDDEPAAAMLGRSVAAYKTLVLAWGSMLAALTGAFYVHWIGYASTEQFDPRVTFYLWAGIVVGGASNAGAWLGCAAIAGLFEATRFIGDFGFTALSETQIASVRWIIIGLVLILTMRFRPQGLLPVRTRLSRSAAPTVTAPAASGDRRVKESADA